MDNDLLKLWLRADEVTVDEVRGLIKELQASRDTETDLIDDEVYQRGYDNGRRIGFQFGYGAARDDGHTGDGFWYLATPYSRFADGIEQAFRFACEETARLMRAGVQVFSPIAHSHPIAVHGKLDPFNLPFWLDADQPLMEAARGLIVVRGPGWEASHGIAAEIAAFREAGKPVVFMDPGLVPPEFRK